MHTMTFIEVLEHVKDAALRQGFDEIIKTQDGTEEYEAERYIVEVSKLVGLDPDQVTYK